MKKRIIVVAVLAISIFTACKKQGDQSLKNKEVNYSTLDNSQIIPVIKDFKAAAENATTEGLNKVISMENAIWLAEATVNYDFDYSGTMNNQTTFSTQLDWNIDPNTISKTDATSLYKQLKTIVIDYVAKNNDSKIKLIDIEYESKKININIVSGESFENSRLPADCTPFGTTDYWDSYAGKCGNYYGQGTTSSAWQELTKKLNTKCVTLVCQNGGRIVYTNISTIQINGYSATLDNSSLGVNILNPYDITPQGDGITDFCLYVSEASNSGSLHTCLSPTEMNSYVNSIKYLANLNKPVSKDVINYTLQFSGNGALNYQQILYNLTFTAGTKTCYIESN